MFHRLLAPGDIHRIQEWEVANAAARVALAGQTAIDVGRVCRQIDTGDYYLLYSTGPNVWKQIAVSSGDRRVATTITSSTGVLTIDYSLGDYFKYVMTENITSVVFTNLVAAGIGMSIWLENTQHASAAKTFAFPASFKWEGGTPGVISTGLSARDILALTSIDAGTKWDATLSKARS